MDDVTRRLARSRHARILSIIVGAAAALAILAPGAHAAARNIECLDYNGKCIVRADDATHTNASKWAKLAELRINTTGVAYYWSGGWKALGKGTYKTDAFYYRPKWADSWILGYIGGGKGWVALKRSSNIRFVTENCTTALQVQSNADCMVPLYRHFNGTIGDHFYTTRKAGSDSAVAAGWKLEGVAGYVARDNQADTVPLNRYWKAGVDHFYATNTADHSRALAAGYVHEGTEGRVAKKAVRGAVRFYRLFQAGSGDHFYTTSKAERDSVAAMAGWKDESSVDVMYIWPKSALGSRF